MAPPSTQAKKIPDNPFRCDRLIQYHGKVLPCDSALRRDGESLRAIYDAHTPASAGALEELDQYQSGRNTIRYSAYVGTAGLLIAITAGIVANLAIPVHDGSDPESLRKADQARQQRTSTAKILRAAGLGLTVGSVVFGFAVLRSNEGHLQNSIMKYNASTPTFPIEVLFKTEF